MKKKVVFETVDFVRAASVELRKQDTKAWADKISKHSEQIVTALSWLISHREFQTAMELLTQMTGYWRFRGKVESGRQLCRQFLAATEDEEPSIFRARVLVIAGLLALDKSDTTEASRLASEGLSLSRSLADNEGLSRALIVNAKVAFRQRDHETARALCTECLQFHNSRGEEAKSGIAIHGLAEAERLAENYERAGQLYEQSLAIGRKHGNVNLESLDLHNIGYVELHIGSALKAGQLFKESLVLARSIGNRSTIAYCLIGLGAVDVSLNNTERAAKLFSAGLAELDTLGMSLDFLDQIEYGRYAGRARAALGDVEFESALAQGRTLGMAAALTLVESMAV